MAEHASAPRPRRLGEGWRLGIVWAVALGVARLPLVEWVHSFSNRPDLFEYRWALTELTSTFATTLRITTGTTLFFVLLLAPLAGLGRYLARARVQGGLSDPNAAFRSWVRAHPRGTDGILVAIAVAWSLLLGGRLNGDDVVALGSAHLLASLLGGYAQLLTMRMGVRLSAKPIAFEEPAAVPRKGITYDAVARTNEARAAVVIVLLLSIVMFALVVSLPISTLLHDPRLLAALGTYVAFVLGAAFAFRSASRAAIGIDGVRVYGTSFTRFVAYRDLDEVRVRGVAIELVRGGRVQLAIELHSADAAHRLEVKQSIADAIALAHREKGSTEQSLVEASTAEELAQGALGVADYRRAAMTRDQLWTVVESAAGAAGARKNALEALARSGDPADRERLRIAAEQCAEPTFRAVARELAATEPERDPLEEGGQHAPRRAEVPRPLR